jgi:hypothetical protein
MQLQHSATWTEAILRNGDYNRLRHWLVGADYRSGELVYKNPSRYQYVASETDDLVTIDMDYNGTAFTVDSEANQSIAVLFDLENTTSSGFVVNVDALTTASGVVVSCDSASTGARSTMIIRETDSAAVNAQVLGVSTATTHQIARFTSTAPAAMGPTVDLYHNSGSPAVNDVLGRIRVLGEDASSGINGETYMQVTALTVTAAGYTTQFSFWVDNQATQNEAVRIQEESIWVDAVKGGGAATSYVNAYDAWDDAKLLQMHNDLDEDRAEFWRKTDDMGITAVKYEEQGEEGGRMMDLAKGIKLGWGAAAQNREAIDQVKDVVRMMAKETLGLDDPFAGLPLNASDSGSVIDVSTS